MDEFKEVIAPFTNPLVIMALMVAMSLSAQIQAKLINIQVPVRAYWAYLSETENQPLLIKALSNISIICLLVLYISIIICFFWRFNNVHKAHKSSDAQARSRLEKEISRLLKKSGYWRKQAARVSGLEKLLAERNASLKQIRIELEELKSRKSRSGYSTRPAQHPRTRLGPAPSLDDTDYFEPKDLGVGCTNKVRPTIKLLRTSKEQEKLIKDQVKEIEDLRRHVSSYEAQIQDLRRQNVGDRPKANDERHKAELSSLREQLERALCDVKKHKTDAGKAQNEIKKIPDTIRSKEREVRKQYIPLEVEYEKLKGIIRRDPMKADHILALKESELAEVRNKYNALLTEQQKVGRTPSEQSNNTFPTIVVDLAEDLAKAQKEIRKLKEQLDETEKAKDETIAELRDEKEDAEDMTKSLRKQLTKAEHELAISNGSSSRTSSTVSLEDQELSAYREQLTQKEKDMSNLRSQAEQEVSNLSRELSQKEAQIRQLLEDASQKTGDTAQAEAHAGAGSSISIPEAEYEQAKQEYLSVMNQNQRLRADMKSMAKELSTTHIPRNEHEKALHDLEQTAESIHTEKITEIEWKIELLKGEKETLEQEKADLTSANDDMKGKTRTLQTEKLGLQVKVDRLEKERDVAVRRAELARGFDFAKANADREDLVQMTILLNGKVIGNPAEKLTDRIKKLADGFNDARNVLNRFGIFPKDNMSVAGRINTLCDKAHKLCVFLSIASMQSLLDRMDKVYYNLDWFQGRAREEEILREREPYFDTIMRVFDQRKTGIAYFGEIREKLQYAKLTPDGQKHFTPEQTKELVINLIKWAAAERLKNNPAKTKGKRAVDDEEDTVVTDAPSTKRATLADTRFEEYGKGVMG